MPKNPFAAKPGSKKLNNPASVCPLTKAQIAIEAYSFDPRNAAIRQPLSGVGLAVTGGPTTTTPSKTGQDGKWRYQPLNPGTYTVAPTFTSEQSDLYDTTGVANDSRALAAGGAATVVFLVPSTWVEFIVHDTAANPLPNIDWELSRRKNGAADFEFYDFGTTGADGKVERVSVGRGTHQLKVKTLTNPTWSATEAVIGEEITLQADASGFQSGQTGNFDIIDGNHLATVLGTVLAKVVASPVTAGVLVLQAKYKPAAGTFANLKHSRIRFRARIGNTAVLSAPLRLLNADSLLFEDALGKTVDQQVELTFTGGTNTTVNTAKGKADVKFPWGETLLAVRLNGLNNARVQIGTGGIAIR